MKNNAAARIVIWSVVTVLLLGVMVTGIVFGILSGWSGSGIGWSTYEDAGDYSVGGASVSDEIDRLEINWVSGSVTVKVYDGDTIELQETEVEKSDDQLRYLVKNGSLTIQYRRFTSVIGIFLFRTTPDKQLTVLLPQKIADEMESVVINTTSADISVSGIRAAGELRTDTVSGGTLLRDVISADIDCSTVSGGVTAENLTADKLSVTTVSGGSVIVGAVSKAEFDSTSGDLELRSSVTPRSVETDTVSGRVKLIIPEKSGFTAEYDGVSGNLYCDFPYEKRGDKYICGDGGADFEFDSVSGDVTITSAH